MQIDPNELAIAFGGKGSAPTAAAKSEHARVSPEQQQLNDVDRRKILEDQLSETIKWFEENNRKETPAGAKEGKEFKDKLVRTEGDIAALKREINRMGPAPAALPAVAAKSETPPAVAESEASPAEKTTVGEMDPSELNNSFLEETQQNPEYQFWTPERMAAAFGGGAGLLFGNPLKGDPGSMAAQLAERLTGAQRGAVRGIYEGQNPSSSNAIARQLAEQFVPPVPEIPLSATIQEPNLTSGEKWAAKTGYGIGTGDVQDVSSRYQRASSKGKVSGRLDKLWGPKLPGEPDSLADRLIFRQQQAEAAQAAAEQVARDRLANEEAQRQNLQPAQQERQRAVDRLAAANARAKTLYDIQSGVMGKTVNALSGAMGAHDVYSGLANMFPKDETNNEYGYAPNSSNVPQTIGGIGALYALRNPYVGLPVAGGAKVFEAARDISKAKNATADTGTQAVSGLGMMAMPWFPYTGLAMQAPAAWNAMYEMSKENPDWLKSATGVDVFSKSKVDPKTLLPTRQ